MTLGEFGAVVFPKSGGPQIEVPALPVDRIDATGAGDSFAGIFLACGCTAPPWKRPLATQRSAPA